MPRIAWGNPGERKYETGLDRGVLYMPDGTAYPWNGLISVDQKFGNSRESVFFDGMKVGDIVTVGEFSALMRAVSYPPEFDKLESVAEIRPGVKVNGQMPATFGLSYRTLKGSDSEGIRAGYKIHVIWNVLALPSDRSYQTRSDDPSLVEFEWELSAVPEELSGFKPTAHLTFDSEELDEWLMEDIEAVLYGSPDGAYPVLPSIAALAYLVSIWARVRVTDNGNGTWNLVDYRSQYVTQDGNGKWTAEKVNVVYLDLDNETFLITDTVSPMDQIDIRVNGDGTWVAITDNNAVIQDIDGEFTIYDIDPVLSGPDMFLIRSKTKE